MSAKRSRILETVHAAARDLRAAGVMSQVTMREFDALCLPKVKPFSARQIQRIRGANRVSQEVFAAYLNTSPSTVRQWEQGKKRPSGPALRLLDLVARKGLQVLEDRQHRVA
jgi:putative transcriptional regulator